MNFSSDDVYCVWFKLKANKRQAHKKFMMPNNEGIGEYRARQKFSIKPNLNLQTILNKLTFRD